MLNNRQGNNNRRRGRNNNQRPQGNGQSRNGENGSRIDNRARGNAPQLLEKYKNLAREAQMAGDRVLTEYYHQFADHYFRVVAETRTRFEENRRPREDWDGEGEDGQNEARASYDDGLDDDDMNERTFDDNRGNRAPQQPQQQPQRQRDYMGDRNGNNDRNGNGQSHVADMDDGEEVVERQPFQRAPRENRYERPREDRPVTQARAPREDRPQREDRPHREEQPRRPRFERFSEDAASPEAEAHRDMPLRLDAAVLPPAIAPNGSADFSEDASFAGEADAAAPKKRGRPRKIAVESTEA